jgi:hypothetical protein
MKRTALFALLLAAAAASAPVIGIAAEPVPPWYAAGIAVGNSYTPDAEVAWVLLTGAAVYDYETVMGHAAPLPLRFKFEGSVGAATVPHPRFTAAADILALHFLDFLSTATVRPYVEGGVGLIYTDFQRREQGFRVNFNPVGGIGALFTDREGGPAAFAAVRFHHYSNGNLHEDNRGMSSLLLMAGLAF